MRVKMLHIFKRLRACKPGRAHANYLPLTLASGVTGEFPGDYGAKMLPFPQE
jgi:hypothetical protein